MSQDIMSVTSMNASELEEVSPLHLPLTIKITGWVKAIRSGKKNTFIELRLTSPDKTLQCVVSSNTFPSELTVESYVTMCGTLTTLPPKAKSRLPFEMQINGEIIIHSRADPDYQSICPPHSSQQTQMLMRHLWVRTPNMVLLTKCRTGLIKSIRRYFDYYENILEVIPPSFTSVECEGGATLFSLKHPGTSTDKPMNVYLTQSSQFALEYMVPAVGTGVYCIAPSFRAENSHTRRHLTEFLHAEAEWPQILKFSDHLNHLTKFLTTVVELFAIENKYEIAQLGLTEHVQQQLQLCREAIELTHTEAIKKCNELGIYKNPETQELFGERDDIPEAQERQLIDKIGKVVLLTKFPREFKSFYMALDPEDLSRVLGCDVEVPGVGEIIGSGVRESDPERLQARLIEAGLVPDDYREYIDLRKCGFGMTSGMGLGIDRMLTWLLKLHNIRDVVTFPRYPGYARP
jgi:asparaginyl-tRNA synthetase